MSFRGFIAADMEPGEELIGVLRDMRRSGADLKVVRPELMHITLKFLGDTGEELVEEISSRIEAAVHGVEPFSVRLVGMGAFPSMSNVRVVWVGMEDGQMLADIAQRLDSSLRELGFERDSKGFKAHLTLARAKSPRGMAQIQTIIRDRAATDFGVFRVDSIKLKKSVLSPQGPTYHTLREIGLGQGDTAVRLNSP